MPNDRCIRSVHRHGDCGPCVAASGRSRGLLPRQDHQPHRRQCHRRRLRRSMRGCSRATCRATSRASRPSSSRNMPGAGGMVMSNHMYSQAPRDGLTIGMMSRSNPIEPVLGNPSAKFKSEEFTWLGTSSSYEDDAYCIVIRADCAVQDHRGRAEARAPACCSAGSPPAAPTPIIVLIARDVFKLNTQLIRGYSSAELNLAIQRGEVEGRAIGMSSISNRSRRLAQGRQAALPAAVRPRDALEGAARRADRARARQDRRRQGAARARRAAVPDGASVPRAARRAGARRPTILKKAFMETPARTPTICAKPRR